MYWVYWACSVVALSAAVSVDGPWNGALAGATVACIQLAVGEEKNR